MQQKFRFAAALASLALFVIVVAADAVIGLLPDRKARPPALAAVAFESIELPAADFAPLTLVGAWRLTSTEPRVGGISGLGLEADEVVAISDAGFVLRFPRGFRARTEVQVADLPAGPGSERFKENRDSEAIFRDPEGRGWWIAFENRDQLWLFDLAFERALKRVAVPAGSLSLNIGIEGLTGSANGLLAFPESGQSVIRWSGGRWRQSRLDGQSPVSDAVQIDDRSIFVIERSVTRSGFRNVLALVRFEGETFRTVWRKRLPVGWRDNVEAVAAEPIAGGGYRLWLMTDDNFHPRLRTVLLIIDVPAAALPKRL